MNTRHVAGSQPTTMMKYELLSFSFYQWGNWDSKQKQKQKTKEEEQREEKEGMEGKKEWTEEKTCL